MNKTQNVYSLFTAMNTRSEKSSPLLNLNAPGKKTVDKRLRVRNSDGPDMREPARPTQRRPPDLRSEGPAQLEARRSSNMRSLRTISHVTRKQRQRIRARVQRE